MRFIILLISLFISSQSFALAPNESHTNLLAISQGISSPNFTSISNFSKGYTSENPVGAAYLGTMRATAQLDDNAFGGEFGVGNGKFGMAFGYLEPDCSGCDGRFRANLAGVFSGIGLGLGISENNYSFGFLLGANDKFRFGGMLEVQDQDLADDITSFGLGFSYVDKNFTFSADASKMDGSSTIRFSPGVALRIQILSFSVSYDTYLDDDANREDDLWFGLGVGANDHWHLAVYVDYVSDWTVNFSLFF